MNPARRTHFLLPGALVLSAALHLALLAVDHAPPPAATGHTGQYGLQLELVTARTPAARPPAPLPQAPARPQAHRVSATVKKNSTARATPAAQPPAPPATAAHADVKPGAGATAGTTETASQETLRHQLHSHIRHAMQPYFSYPMLARRRGWQGTVKVGLRITAEGHISQLHIVEASRHPILDRAALDSLGCIETVPGAVAWLGGRHSDIVLPVEYRLTDS
jgi:protein TonB